MIDERQEMDRNSPSHLASFGEGRLGNQMSSFATLYGLTKEYNVVPLITEDQAATLRLIKKGPLIANYSRN